MQAQQKYSAKMVKCPSVCKAIIIFDEYMEDQAQNSLDETDNSCDCILSARFAVF